MFVTASDSFSVWVPLRAVAKQRPRLGRRRRGRQVAFTPQATKTFEGTLADIVREALPKGYVPFSKSVCVNLEIHGDGFEIQVVPAECSVRPVGVRGDIDNLVKSIFDGLNGVAWVDDRQVELMTVGFVGVPRKGTEYVEVCRE